jgi:hypothetical protein
MPKIRILPQKQNSGRPQISFGGGNFMIGKLQFFIKISLFSGKKLPPSVVIVAACFALGMLALATIVVALIFFL